MKRLHWASPAALFVILVAVSPALAQRGRRAAPAEDASIAPAVQMLDAESADEVRLGIETLGATGSPRAIAPLEARIRKGLPAPLLEIAVTTLGVIARPEAGAILFELAGHRRAEIRAAAITAIIGCRPRGADSALVTALSDGDPRVRGLAATGLGEVGTRAAIDPLFHAFDRHVPEAITAIGLLASSEDVARLLEYLGREPVTALSPAFDEIFARSDVSERAKLDIVGRLAELATPEVKVYLERIANDLPPGRGNDAVRRAAQEAAQRIAG